MENLEDRSVFQSIKIVFSSIADALVGMTSAVGKMSSTAEALADTGLVMAQSNRTIVTMDTMGKESKQVLGLQDKYGDSMGEIYSDLTGRPVPNKPKAKK